MNYQISFSNNFKKSFKRLTLVEKQLFYSKLELFIKDTNHPSPRTKKMKGTKILFESSINMSKRVIWHYANKELIMMIDIGHHDFFKYIKKEKKSCSCKTLYFILIH
jgi:mRNA-degrading endonuclease YafQ of YafQ-DinJ toxin-antitoxin module